MLIKYHNTYALLHLLPRFSDKFFLGWQGSDWDDSVCTEGIILQRRYQEKWQGDSLLYWISIHDSFMGLVE